MRASRTELIVQLDGARSVVSHDGALAGGALHPAVAEALIAQARSVADRVPLTIRFIAMESDGVSTDSVAAVVRAHFARMAQRHTQQISDIFRFARVATALGLLVVVVLLACAQAIPDEASKLMLGCGKVSPSSPGSPCGGPRSYGSMRICPSATGADSLVGSVMPGCWSSPRLAHPARRDRQTLRPERPGGGIRRFSPPVRAAGCPGSRVWSAAFASPSRA